MLNLTPPRKSIYTDRVAGIGHNTWQNHIFARETLTSKKVTSLHCSTSASLYIAVRQAAYAHPKLTGLAEKGLSKSNHAMSLSQILSQTRHAQIIHTVLCFVSLLHLCSRKPEWTTSFMGSSSALSLSHILRCYEYIHGSHMALPVKSMDPLISQGPKTNITSKGENQ